MSAPFDRRGPAFNPALLGVLAWGMLTNPVRAEVDGSTRSTAHALGYEGVGDLPSLAMIDDGDSSLEGAAEVLLSLGRLVGDACLVYGQPCRHGMLIGLEDESGDVAVTSADFLVEPGQE